ncbi:MULTISPECIES: LapA family protein [Pseudomonadati]|uniref:Probable lipopolysaccharide assembly protein A n=1 Tax=Shewanella aestuarii TaxID=1028752 RepID=A0ABT0KX12_9GAMM|nr:lipopolysaccharide assembly protein LapA domain-containing protein [Shewanella aestuarii]MCL1116007.1 lipopolysaccharide assembly protein LapA domain-containing protein [Shewanella aestuarii]GGN69944.1 putative lipopolysaccharide assembly protein A [Shewanella aestuarii]
MKSFFAIIIVGMLFILALLFGAKNEQVVTLSYFVAEGQYRLPVVLAVVFLTGFVLSWLLASFYIMRMKLALRKANKNLAKLAQSGGDNNKTLAVQPHVDIAP